MTAKNLRMLHASLSALGTSLRRDSYDGRECVIAPVVLLVEGVHNDLFYPADEIAATARAWNGIPVPIFHPERNGSYVSANSPEVISERSVGRMFNIRYDERYRSLKGDAWIEIAKAQAIYPELLSLLESGGRIEVSTGLFTSDDGTPGEWRGESFTSTVRNFQPDHLAILPGGEGACNWEDGCGIRANLMNLARTPTFDGYESISWAGVATTFAAYRDAYYAAHGGTPETVASTVAAAPAGMKTWIAAKTLLGDPAADNNRDLIFFPVVNPRTGRLNEGALRAVLGGRAAQANIPAMAKQSAQAKARALLNEHFGTNLEGNMRDRLIALIRTIAEKLGVSANELSMDDKRVAVARALDGLDNEGWMHFIRDLYDDRVIYDARGNNPSETGQTAAVIKTYQRAYTMDAETGMVTLASETQEVREERSWIPIGPAGAITQAGPAGAGEAGPTTQGQKEKLNMSKEKIEALIACKCTKFAENDRAWLETLDEGKLDLLVPVEQPAPASPPPVPPVLPAANAAPAVPPSLPAVKPIVPVTVESFLATAPADVKATINRSLLRDKAEKDAVVTAILANERNKFEKADLDAMPIETLNRLVELGRVDVSYAGAGGGPPSTGPAGPPVMKSVFKRPSDAVAA